MATHNKSNCDASSCMDEEIISSPFTETNFIETQRALNVASEASANKMAVEEPLASPAAPTKTSIASLPTASTLKSTPTYGDVSSCGRTSKTNRRFREKRDDISVRFCDSESLLGKGEHLSPQIVNSVNSKIDGCFNIKDHRFGLNDKSNRKNKRTKELVALDSEESVRSQMIRSGLSACHTHQHCDSSALAFSPPSVWLMRQFFSDQNQQPEDLVDHILSFCDDKRLRMVRALNKRYKQLSERICQRRAPAFSWLLLSVNPPLDLNHRRRHLSFPSLPVSEYSRMHSAMDLSITERTRAKEDKQRREQQHFSVSNVLTPSPSYVEGLEREEIIYYQDEEQDVRFRKGWSYDTQERLIEQLFGDWGFLQEGFLPPSVANTLQFPQELAMEQLRSQKYCNLHRNRYSGMHLKAHVTWIEEFDHRLCFPHMAWDRLQDKENYKQRTFLSENIKSSSPGTTFPSLHSSSLSFLDLLQLIQSGLFWKDERQSQQTGLENNETEEEDIEEEGASDTTFNHDRFKRDVFNSFVSLQYSAQSTRKSPALPQPQSLKTNVNATELPCFRFALAELEYRCSHHGLIAKRKLCSLMFTSANIMATPVVSMNADSANHLQKQHQPVKMEFTSIQSSFCFGAQRYGRSCPSNDNTI